MSRSPTPGKVNEDKGMTFTEALNRVCDGERVTRKGWNDKSEYGFLINDELKIHTKGETHVWSVHLTDMTADDWTLA